MAQSCGFPIAMFDFWKQLRQLGLNRPMTSCPGFSCGPTGDALQATTRGLCLSMGLFSAGLVVSFLGLPRIGSFARRMALVQGISQVVIASQATRGKTPLNIPSGYDCYIYSYG